MIESKNTKLIGIGNEGIKKLEEVESKISDKIDTEKINMNKDVDKDYVRALLDGVDILLLTYSSEDKQALQIVNAIGYMAEERRVLSVGLDLSEKENKDEIKINRIIKINDNNTTTLLNIVEMIIDSIADECTISIDLTDIKEGLASDMGIKYSYGEFSKSDSVEDIANKLIEASEQTSEELTGKKLMILVEMSSVYDIAYLNEVLNAIQDKSEDSYEAIFSLYLKEDLEDKIKVSLIYN
ncbi:cell division protein [Romboutsia sp. 13368]|uniref:cell division protein n=1 Tax=Romboutsia sp. 13368 TaxID=2708053 RepID=UPI0025F5029B|nr:cell division protein [Romboutsia sp. 13368]